VTVLDRLILSHHLDGYGQNGAGALAKEHIDFYQHNLAALKKLYPGLASMLKQQKPGTALPEEFSVCPDWDKQWNDSAELHIVYRFASSEMAQQLFHKINLAELTERKNRRLLLLEDRPHDLVQALCLRDWTTMIRSEICLISFSPPTKNVTQRLLHFYPDIAFSDFQVYGGGCDITEDELARVESHVETVQEQVRREIECKAAQFDKQARAPFPRHIRFFAAGHNIFQDACIRAFAALGYGAGRFQWKSPLYRFVCSSAWVRDIERNPFDTIFLFNATPKTFSRQPYLAEFPVRAVSWFVDHPARYAHTRTDYEGCDCIGVFDSTYIPYLQARSKARIREVRTGYGIDVAKAIPRDDYAKIPVAFVGELGTRGFLAIERGLTEAAPDMVKTANEILKAVDFRNPVYLSPIAEDYFKRHGVEYQGLLVEYLENKATSVRRRYYLDALADRGLVIFGDEEWGQAFAGVLNSCYAGKRIDYTTDLPSLYASAKININIFHVQCIAAPNPRVYDVMACGGFLLTTDNPGLADEFEIGKEIVVFHNAGELRELVDYYLNHEKERMEIAKKGQERVLAKCGYHDRMQAFLREIQPLEGDAYVYLRR
jgi:hypothetical protein